MMRSILVRLGTLAGAVVVVASCDTRLPTSASSLGGSGSSSTVSGNLPSVTIDAPTSGAMANVGDSILVVMHLHGTNAVQSVAVSGLSLSGSQELGTLTRTVRYAEVVAPSSGSFRPGLRDTTVRRYIKPISANDIALDSLIIQAVVTDSTGGRDSTTRRVDLVSGPRVTVLTPANGDSTPAGIGLSVRVRAEHATGIASVTVHVRGEASWPTPLDTSITQLASGSPSDVSFPSVTARIPADAPLSGRITVAAAALDITGQAGNAPAITVFVRGGSPAQPLVGQTVGPRSEIGDSIAVTAHGDGLVALGYVARTIAGVVVARDSISLPQPYAGNATAQVSLRALPAALQGQKITISSFAVDQSGRTGYAVHAGQATPEGTLTHALIDSTLVVYGRTYSLPSARNKGLVGDLVWDAPRQQVILSNQQYNRLEVFHAASKSFDANGVAVGSFPWGLFVSNNPNVLWVANSGGTNLSRVDLTTLHEMDGQRIRTRLTPLYTLTESVDSAASADSTQPPGPVYREGLSDPVLYSDRPQYVGQLKNNMLYYSTRPTSDAPKGTIRYLDPSQPYPDAMPIIIFKKASPSIKSHIIVNADSMFVISGASRSDILIIWDHRPGTNDPGQAIATTQGFRAAIAALHQLNGSDVSFVDGVDITDAGLTDTTYVAVSGDRNWIAFGSGHTAGSGNIFMSSAAGYFSPPISQVDLTNNASEPVNGLALDSIGLTVAAHGAQSFFASVDDPFHLRLQGKYSNAAAGQGIVMHPQAKGSTGDVQRTAYVASGNSTIEIVDVFHYLNRGTLPIKANLYGPLRATLPGPSDPPDVVLKLFGVSANGLVVIDVRANDILPSP